MFGLLDYFSTTGGVLALTKKEGSGLKLTFITIPDSKILYNSSLDMIFNFICLKQWNQVIDFKT